MENNTMSDIKEAAIAVLKLIKLNDFYDSTDEIAIDDTMELVALEAALKPSKSECADWLEEHNAWRRGGEGSMQNVKELGKIIEQSIKYLREEI